jgi:hypothetical protein
MAPVPYLRLDIEEGAYDPVDPSSSRILIHGRWTDEQDFDLLAIEADRDDDEVEVKILPGVRRGFLGSDPDDDPRSPSQTGPSSSPVTSRTKEVGSPIQTQTSRSIVSSSSMIAKAIPSQTEEEESRPSSASTLKVDVPSTMTERPSQSTAPAEITAAPSSSSEWHAPSSSANTNTGRNSWAPDPTWSSDSSAVPTSNVTFTDQIKAVSDACTESTDSCQAAAKISPVAAACESTRSNRYERGTRS